MNPLHSDSEGLNMSSQLNGYFEIGSLLCENIFDTVNDQTNFAVPTTPSDVCLKSAAYQVMGLLKKSTPTHPDMGVLFVSLYFDICHSLPQSSQLSMQYHDQLDCFIIAFNCTRPPDLEWWWWPSQGGVCYFCMCVNTLRLRPDGRYFCWRHVPVHFLDWMKTCHVIEICSPRSNWQQAIIVSDNGLSMNRRQAIIWTIDGITYWCIYASLGLHELNNIAKWNCIEWLTKTGNIQPPFLPLSPNWARGVLSSPAGRAGGRYLTPLPLSRAQFLSDRGQTWWGRFLGQDIGRVRLWETWLIN